MKTSALILALVWTTATNAQWGSDVNISNTASPSSIPMNNGRPMISDGNRMHLVYADAATGNPEIYYRKSTNGGSSWLPAVNISNNLTLSFDPSVYFSNNIVWVVWIDNSQGNNNIHYSTSIDYGDTWTPTVVIPATTISPNTLSTCAIGDVLWVTWNAGNYVKLSQLYGSQWSPQADLFSGFSYGAPAIASDGSSIIIALTTEPLVQSGDILYRRSINGGIIFSTAAPLPGQQNTGTSPDIAIEGSHVHITWVDTRDGVPHIYYQHSGDLGFSWDAARLISVGSADNYFPSIAAEGDNVVITWERDVSGNVEIYYANSSTAGITWNIQERLTVATQSSERSCVDMSSTGKTHVVWIDYRDFNYEIYNNSTTSLPPSGGIGLDELSFDFSVVSPVESNQSIALIGTGLTSQHVVLSDLNGNCIPMNTHSTNTGLELIPSNPLARGIYLVKIGGLAKKVLVL